MRDLVVGNGRLTLCLDQDGSIREIFHPSPGQWNHTLGAACSVGIICEGTVIWLGLPHAPEMKQDGSLSASTTWTVADAGVKVEQQLHCNPKQAKLKREFVINAAPNSVVTLMLHHDFRLFETEHLDGVHYLPEQRAIVHSKRGLRMSLAFEDLAENSEVSWTLGRRDGEGGRGVRALVERSGLDNNPCAVGAGESVLAVTLPCDSTGSARVTATLIVDDGQSASHETPTAPTPHPLPADSAGNKRIMDFARAQLEVFSGCMIASPDTTMLADAREHYGYIWPRDGAFVARTCLAEGRHEATLAFLRFCASSLTEEGWLHQRYHPDGSPGSSWHPQPEPGSPLRPIQEDSTALTCLVACEYLEQVVDKSRDGSLLEELVVPTAAFLLDYRSQETGLPLPSHDLWEERFGIHTFTVTTVIAALRAAARVTAAAHPDLSHSCEEGAESMQRAMEHHLFHEEAGRYARTAHPKDDGDLHLDTTPDASLAGLFLFDHGAADNPRVAATMRAVESLLTVRHGIGGIARYQDDHYHRRSTDPERVPGNPWLICTLWIAAWHAVCGRLDEARAGVDWVATRARPTGALPEQVHPLTGENVSVCPLLWSHSTLLDTCRLLPE